jgi:hypothetical protein
MKTVLGVIAFIALGMTAADAATLNVMGTLASMVTYNCDPPTVPEPTTWALAILGFSFLAHRVRSLTKAKA